MREDRVVYSQDSPVVVNTDASVISQHETPREIDLSASSSDQTRKSPELLELWLSEFSQADLCFQYHGLASSSGTLRPRTSTTLQRGDTEISKGDGALDQTAVEDDVSLVPQELRGTHDGRFLGAHASTGVLSAREDLIGFGAILPFDQSQSAIRQSQAVQSIVVGAVLPSDRSKTVVTESQAEEDRSTGFEPATLVVYLNGEAKSCRARFDTGSAIHIMAEKVAKRFTGIDQILVGAGDGMIMASNYEKVQGHSRHDCTVLGMMKMTFYLDQEGKPRSWPYRDFFYILSDDDVQGNFDVMISEKFVKKYRLLEQGGTNFGLAFKTAIVGIGHTFWISITNSCAAAWNLGGSVIVASAACCVTSRRSVQKAFPSL